MKIKCEKSHVYDTQTHTQCPYCGLNINPRLFEKAMKFSNEQLEVAGEIDRE